MREISWAEKKKAVTILTETFENNPGSAWLLRNGINRRKGIKRLCNFVLIHSFVRNGAFISDNGKGIALCYRFNKKAFSLREFFAMLWFGITSISFKRYGEVMSRESYRRGLRPVDGNYLYFWFFGVAGGGGRDAWDLARGIFSLADREGLDIYLETALPRMKPIYERFGFTTYHFWEDKEKNIMFWFMMRKPGTSY